MKGLLRKSISKTYVILVILITSITVGSYISYAMFTVTEEKNNAISIVTGNLYYDLKVDGAASNTLTVPANSFKEFMITLTNTNNRTTRLNLYYAGNVSDEVDVAYIEEGYNSIPAATGENFTSGASKQYKIRVSNISNSSVTVNLGVEAGLDYNDLSIPSNGHEIRKMTIRGLVADVVKDDIMNRLNTRDSEQTFVTGENPNNYIWYSGKLWRAVSIDPTDNSVKLVTQWDISAIPYNPSNQTAFEGSYMEEWLNDTSVDGFLGNLREPDKFIKMDSRWNATLTTDTTKPPKTTMVEAAVGLLNIYEYTMSYSGTTESNSYLNNGLYWWTLTPYSVSKIHSIDHGGIPHISGDAADEVGIRPVINLQKTVKIIEGRGTEDDPYRLDGDNDSDLAGVLLNTRYSGEYIRFGAGENNLYRIVSHETSGLTKITSAEPLKSGGSFITSAFGNNVNYSSNNTIGTFLNGDYLVSYVGANYRNMIEENTTWYFGTVNLGGSYWLAKYSSATGNDLTSNTTIAPVGLLRLGELMSGQFERYAVKGGYDATLLTVHYWLLTPRTTSDVRYVDKYGYAHANNSANASAIRPSMNLKSNVVITGGSGTKSDPFTITLGS